MYNTTSISFAAAHASKKQDKARNKDRTVQKRKKEKEQEKQVFKQKKRRRKKRGKHQRQIEQGQRKNWRTVNWEKKFPIDKEDQKKEKKEKSIKKNLLYFRRSIPFAPPIPAEKRRLPTDFSTFRPPMRGENTKILPKTVKNGERNTAGPKHSVRQQCASARRGAPRDLYRTPRTVIFICRAAAVHAGARRPVLCRGGACCGAAARARTSGAASAAAGHAAAPRRCSVSRTAGAVGGAPAAARGHSGAAARRRGGAMSRT
jgi:hypothetical protein